MMDYLIQITVLFSIVFTIAVVILNSSNPPLLDVLKPVVLAGLGLIGVVIYFFAFAYLEEVMRVLRNRLMKQRGGCFIVIILPVIALSVLTIPALILEWAVPGHGWLPWLFISGAVWRGVFFVSIRLHEKIRALVLPDEKAGKGNRSVNTSTKI